MAGSRSVKKRELLGYHMERLRKQVAPEDALKDKFAASQQGEDWKFDAEGENSDLLSNIY